MKVCCYCVSRRTGVYALGWLQIAALIVGLVSAFYSWTIMVIMTVLHLYPSVVFGLMLRRDNLKSRRRLATAYTIYLIQVASGFAIVTVMYVITTWLVARSASISLDVVGRAMIGTLGIQSCQVVIVWILMYFKSIVEAYRNELEPDTFYYKV